MNAPSVSPGDVYLLVIEAMDERWFDYAIAYVTQVRGAFGATGEGGAARAASRSDHAGPSDIRQADLRIVARVPGVR